MSDVRAYLRSYGLMHPSRMVMRRGAALLHGAMSKHLRGRVLDIGCGAKAKRLLLDDQITDYVGLDHAESLHGTAQVDLLGTAYEIPAADNSFDGVVCTAVLEHLEEPGKALRESLRVLKPGGHAVYTVPLFYHLHEEPRDFYRYTCHGLRYLFEGAGYRIVTLEPASGFWITFGTELSQYLLLSAPRVARFLARAITALNNLLCPLLDRLDRRRNPASQKFTWMYLVVATKPL